jgi:hypothetical protein
MGKEGERPKAGETNSYGTGRQTKSVGETGWVGVAWGEQTETDTDTGTDTEIGDGNRDRDRDRDGNGDGGGSLVESTGEAVSRPGLDIHIPFLSTMLHAQCVLGRLVAGTEQPALSPLQIKVVVVYVICSKYAANMGFLAGDYIRVNKLENMWSQPMGK